MNADFSYELKIEILNAVRKRNEMFAKWIDLCSSRAFLMVLLITLINATHLEEIILFIGIFIAAKFKPSLIYTIICAMLVVGVVFMILDATENERSKKKIREIYNIKTKGRFV